MKKWTTLLLTAALVCTLSACGGGRDRARDEEPSEQGEETGKEMDEAEEEEANQNQDVQMPDNSGAQVSLPMPSVTYKVAGKNIYVDVPYWQEIEKGYTRLFTLHGERYVAVSTDKNNTAASLEEAHNLAFEKFKGNIQTESYVNFLNIEEESTETINGIEVYKYEGTVNCGHDTVYDAYVIGYSFIMDGIPCNITGSVIDQAQDAEMIDEMRLTVEAMIQTVRSEQ